SSRLMMHFCRLRDPHHACPVLDTKVRILAQPKPPAFLCVGYEVNFRFVLLSPETHQIVVDMW
ncbi:MAG: hypothetical protein VX786_00780, partial [Pseudomonadota bacterium]|nr:hypothetical protein [Pseudomonadota bacterium]